MWLITVHRWVVGKRKKIVFNFSFRFCILKVLKIILIILIINLIHISATWNITRLARVYYIINLDGARVLTVVPNWYTFHKLRDNIRKIEFIVDQSGKTLKPLSSKVTFPLFLLLFIGFYLDWLYLKKGVTLLNRAHINFHLLTYPDSKLVQNVKQT